MFHLLSDVTFIFNNTFSSLEFVNFHKTSLTPPHSIEVHMYQARYVSGHV